MIRSATASDALAIARVHLQSWEETYRGKVPDHALDAQTYDLRARQWQSILAQPETIVFLSEVQGVVAGFAMARFEQSEPGYGALLDTLYVLRAHHRRGIARKLLRAVAATLTDRGVKKMWLLTLRDENPARAFYERLGATVIREQPAPAILGAGIVDCVYGIDLACLT